MPATSAPAGIAVPLAGPLIGFAPSPSMLSVGDAPEVTFGTEHLFIEVRQGAEPGIGRQRVCRRCSARGMRHRKGVIKEPLFRCHLCARRVIDRARGHALSPIDRAVGGRVDRGRG